MELIALDFDVITLAAISLGGIGKTLSVVLGLGMVIFFHELGHFAVAKWCDVHVERFSIGIGPIIWSRQKGETEYALSALPFGGYVKMLGQDDMDPNQMTSDEIAENERSYSAKKVWQRMAIISAGVIMNVITGFMFFAIAYRFGVVELVPMVGHVHAGSPAWEAGIRDGDTIRSINGDSIQNFTDINQAVVLSSGSVSIEGDHVDGSPFSTVIMPKLGKTVRMIGVAPAQMSLLSTQIPDEESITIPGLAADQASRPFLPGDRVVAVNGESVRYLHEMAYLTSKYASEELTYSVQRPIEQADGEALTDQFETIEIRVPPKPMKSLGIWMAIGPVTSIVKGSIADKAGLKIDDLITKVDDLTVSKDIDPLRLPNYFAEHAGTPVSVTVTRQTDDKGDVETKLTMIPTDAPGWSERPMTITAPLPISAVGAGIHVQPRIAHIVEGSEAALDGTLRVDQKISSIELQHADPQNIVKDILGDKVGAEKIDLEYFDVDELALGESNWAYVFNIIQQVPNRHVRLHVSSAADAGGGFATVLKEAKAEQNWFIPLRGIRGWERETRVRQAESWSEAASLGLRRTRNSGISIYMTLRSLVQGNLSVKALSGPLGIVSIGYMVADHGTTKLLMFLGFLSINLAVLNFLPIPILDGGHMVFLIWEAVARRKPSPRIINLAHGVGLVFIISLFVFVMYLDIFVNRLGFGG
ncbi:MAG TPA: RIP metalloprotease RseP [Planctomycetes bacterium]|nr:RIP metalloprotease RseP [Fuerstiella sp.]HIK96018.1 RIP metalloprotease RseP [Planctomycetota bacterium]